MLAKEIGSYCAHQWIQEGLETPPWIPFLGDVAMTDLIGVEREKIMRSVVEAMEPETPLWLVHSKADKCFGAQSGAVDKFIQTMESLGHRKESGELDLLVALPYSGFNHHVFNLFAKIREKYPNIVVEKHTSGPLIIIRDEQGSVAEIKPVVIPLGDEEKWATVNGRTVLAVGEGESSQMASIGKIVIEDGELIIQQEPPLSSFEAGIFPIWGDHRFRKEKMKRIIWNNLKLTTTAVAGNNRGLIWVLERDMENEAIRLAIKNPKGLIFEERFEYGDRMMELLVMQNIMGYQSYCQATIFRWLTGVDVNSCEADEMDLDKKYDMVESLNKVIEKMREAEGFDERRIEKYEAWEAYLEQKL